jgi:carboxymethylenebutenolidase
MPTSNFVTIPVPDGTTMQTYIAYPTTKDPAPAIIVLQEAFGVNNHIRNVTDRLAAHGYIAIAPELFHRTASPGLEFAYDDFPAVMPHYQAMTTESIEADMKGTYAWLQQQSGIQKDKIAAIGFCLGGRVSLIANMVLPLAAAVSYYGGGTDPLLDRLNELHAPQLMCWGGLDKHIPAEQIDALEKGLKAANKPYINVVFSDADHGFNCDEKPAYNPKAAKEAWAMTLAFLENNLK